MTGESPQADKIEDIEEEDDYKQGYIELRQDLTQLPMIVNLRNTNYIPHSYYPPECPLCCNKPCKACPLPLNPKMKEFTLRQLIEKVAVQPADKVFRDNAVLYLSKPE